MYSIIFESPVKKFLKKLDKGQAIKIIQRIEKLKQNSRLGIPLTGNFTGLFKLRIGDYRLIYKIDNQKLIIVLLKLGPRKNIYKN